MKRVPVAEIVVFLLVVVVWSYCTSRALACSARGGVAVKNWYGFPSCIQAR